MEIIKASLLLALSITFTQGGVIFHPVEKSYYTPNVTLFDGSDINGPSVTVVLSESSLAGYNFDDKTSSVKGHGLWCLYEEELYNAGNPDAGVLCTGINDFTSSLDESLDNKISSARFIGTPTDITTEGINLFPAKNFGGISYQNINTDWPYLPAEVALESAIISGCSGWSVYTEANYGGECSCLINFSQIVPCFPLLLADKTSMGANGGQINSIRKGCHCA